jgi:cytochrome c-type biogenesis protein CcmF
MVHTLIGNIGHLFIIISFVSALVSAFSYFKAERSGLIEWKYTARYAFYIHMISVIGVVSILFYIIQNNYFEYHYAWSHSSRYLPFYYKIAAFWEGQEGSFLLWIFWHVILGLIIIKLFKAWESPVMFIFSLVQAFLVSMILGVVIFNIKIGSSPFLLVRDVINAPVFEINPDFIPENGSGLNPLLQNYWMVIHPPTLFLGFAASIVPFSFAIAGLWTKKVTEWIKPAFPWASFSAATLGLGIVMGAYWAYETLNFGGYWNWDPVENAIFVPWLILIGGIHTMIIHKKNGEAIKTSYILIISSFLLVVYSTFLTRSGILGESSVHSFTDLGLSGQLLLYLLVFVVLSASMLIQNWKNIPSTNKEISTYNREFWIFIGAIVLSLSAFQVILPTSIPVFNAILNNIGIQSSMAPPADQVMFYTRFQIWFGVGIALLTGIGQYFWWRKIRKENLYSEFAIPVVISLLISSVIMAFSGLRDLSFLILLTSGIFSLVSNGRTFLRLYAKKINLSGGAVSHIGVSLMLIGILYSSGLSNVISVNKSGMIYSNDLPDEVNKENILLFRDEPIQMDDFELLYRGRKIKLEGYGGYFNKNQFNPLRDIHFLTAKEDILKEDKILINKGDTVKNNLENTYYEIIYKKSNGSTFQLYPRLQENPNMGNVVSPSIKKSVLRDIYTHVTVVASDEKEWNETIEEEVQLKKPFFANDYVATVERFERIDEIDGMPLEEGDIAVKAVVKIQGKTKDYYLEPVYLIRDNYAARIPDENEALGIRLTVLKIIPENDSMIMGINTSQKDYVILKAIEKPYINLLWIGTIVLMIGFTLSAVRRTRELKGDQGSK